jgi:mRNA-degrading endonuclease toxin of MazEF toxin-antitoxin module
MRRGDIWTITPLDHPKARPAVIVSVDAWNKHALDVILVPLTTRPGPSRPPVSHSNLKTASYAKCGSVSAMPKTRLKKQIGRLDEKEMAGLECELKRLMGI